MTDIGFDHLHLKSAAPETSAQFYMEAFGALLISRGEVHGRLRLVLELSSVRFFIEEQLPAASSAPQMPFRGLEHFGLKVANLDALAARLRAMDAHFAAEPIVTRPGIKIAFVYGPDGEYIELIERGA